jgi:hypothetical protein
MDWSCSGCGRHYSWIVTECPHCQPFTTITTGGTQTTAAQRPRAKTGKPICKGMPHGSCKGEQECDPNKACFESAQRNT